MYLDAMEYLEEERDGWAPFEALADLSDEQLTRPVPAAHGWSGRDLMGHLLAWQEVALEMARELAVNETSPSRARMDADWDARGGDAINADLSAAWADLPIDEVRERFRTLPGELRGYLTVVPETRWLKHPTHLKSFHDDMTAHYEDHRADLAAIVDAAR
jgi:hypothetical protein